MDDMYGAGPLKGIDKLHKKLEVKVKFKEWTVMSVGDTYMHLKRERELRPGCTVIRPNGKYLKAVLALLGLTSCKAAPTPNVAPQKRNQMKLIRLWTRTRLRSTGLAWACWPTWPLTGLMLSTR